MDLGRREFLKLTGLSAAGLSLSGLPSFGDELSFGKEAYNEDKPLYCGWIDSPKSRTRFIDGGDKPFLSQMNEQIRGTGAGKTVLLWQAMEKVLGHPLVPHNQETGDCFIKDTMVTMANGKQKSIQDITVGDYVLSHLGRAQRVSRVIKKPYSGELITTACKGFAFDITSTPDHKFITRDSKWVSINKLNTELIVPKYSILEQDIIFKEHGKNITTAIKIKNKTKLGLAFDIQTKIISTVEKSTVYCLDVENDHSFIANGYAVHNCVSHSFGLGVDVLTCVQMLQSLVPSVWVAPAATEIIYGGARVQIAKGKYYGEGCDGLDAAEFVKNYGILLRQAYVDGKFNYTRYSGQVANQLGRSGVPGPLLSLCRLHPVKTISLVRTWTECRDAVANGYPIALCSNVGFSLRRGRDSEGFLAPGRAPWNHSMLLAGIDDNSKRPGGLIINSWGDWIDGPKRLEQPIGSFWADASVIDRMVKQNDSVAISSYVGYPPQSIDYSIF